MGGHRHEDVLKTDEMEEAVSALEMVAEQSAHVQEDPYRWKWVILAVHNALQGFMVLALRGSDGLLPLRDEVAQAWLKSYRERRSPPQERLDSFLSLYKKVKSDRLLFYAHSMKFSPREDQERSVRKLNSLRNEFIHFLPRLWLLDLSGLPEICLDCLDVIEFLGWQSGNIFWHNGGREDRAQKALAATKGVLEERKQASV